MLQEALSNRIPLIAARTADPLNATKVVQHFVKGTVVATTLEKLSSTLQTDTTTRGVVYVAYSNDWKLSEDTLVALYKSMKSRQSVLLVLNFSREPPSMFLNVGELPVPKELVTKLLSTWVTDEEQIDGVVSAVKGMTLKQVQDVAMLARETSGGDFQPRRIQGIRQKMLGSLRGLESIDTDMSRIVYLPPKPIAQWMLSEAAYFHHEDLSLRPRGLMFTGAPGAGKTMSAKYIAGSWGMPLYRFDVASTYGKYVGESEQRFMAALASLDREEPCVVLFDEIEKLFTKTGHETSRNILSELLWWLQEHTTQILTLMTTNNLQSIPPEVYRPGRVDRIMEFGSLDIGTAKELCAKICVHYKVKVTKEEKAELLEAMENDLSRTYASIVNYMRSWMKSHGHI